MLFGAAIPVLPGKSERVRRFQEEVEPYRYEYETLNARYALEGHSIWLSHELDGSDVIVNVYDIPTIDDLKKMRSREWDMDSPYDRWWVGWVRDVLGIDLIEGSPFLQPPERVFVWSRDDG